MTPAIPTNANIIFGRPLNWDEEKDGPCLDVHAVKENGIISTIWTPNEAELKSLNEGGFVLLGIFCNQMPPVAIGVVEPDNKDDAQPS